MPELPEAESISRALDKALKGRRITKVEVFFPACARRCCRFLRPALKGANSFLAAAVRVMRWLNSTTVARW